MFVLCGLFLSVTVGGMGCREQRGRAGFARCRERNWPLRMLCAVSSNSAAPVGCFNGWILNVS